MIRYGILVAGVLVALATAVRPSQERAPVVPPKPLASVLATHQINAIAKGLVRLGAPRHRASIVALAIYRHTKGTHIDPFLVAAIASVEDPELNPHARNPSGATGVLQVMPGWLAVYGRRCGRSLVRIDTNVCLGVHVLREHLADMHGSTTRGLLAYSGCVHGGSCSWYATTVLTRYHHIKPNR